MALSKGILKIAGSILEQAKTVVISDGPLTICSDCGSAHHGVCRKCAMKRSSKLWEEGMDEIKKSKNI